MAGSSPIHPEKEEKPSSNKVVTMGCRLNFSESDVMKAWADDNGLNNTIIVNTCAVTAEAERQCKQKIRHLSKAHPEAQIMVTGCAVQLRPKSFAAMPEVHRVLGNDVKESKTAFLNAAGPRVQVGPMPHIHGLDAFPVVPTQGKVKAFVQVQNGCNHFCTFCTIAVARGRSRSVDPVVVADHVVRLLDQGVQEIILTGVDLTSYEWKGCTLAGLVQHLIDTIPGLKRLRLSSLDSIEIDPHLEELITQNDRIMPHIHLSLQSGSDSVLRAMKRRHTRAEAIRVCHALKKRRPSIALGADFITGFPGETDAMFGKTMALVTECELTHLHVFPYSARPGTAAARMPNPVDHTVIKHRASLLRTAGHTALDGHLQGHIGRDITVLVEQPTRGHADDFSCVTWETPVHQRGVYRARVHAVHQGACVVSDMKPV